MSLREELSTGRILRVFATVLVVALVALVLVYAFPSLVGADASYVVLSGSMAPAIGTGDAIVVDSVEPSAIETSDVITFRREGEQNPTTHRVVETIERKDSYAFQTRGDANPNVDPGIVPEEAVVGRVSFVIPYLGYLIRFANRPLGYVTLIGLPLGLLVVGELRSLFEAGRDLSTGSGHSSSPSEITPPDGIEYDHPQTKESGGSITLSRAELRFTVPVLVAFAIYAGWTALAAPTDLPRVVVAIGAGLLAVFAGTAYAVLALETDASSRPTTVPVRIRELDSEHGDTPVTTLQEIIQLAAAAGVPVDADIETQQYQTSVDDTVYYLSRSQSGDQKSPSSTEDATGSETATETDGPTATEGST